MHCLQFKNTLAGCKANKVYNIKKILDDDLKYQLRLLELGFLPGEKVFFKQKSLKKKTFLVEVRGVSYVLQENLAKLVLLEDL